MIDKLYFEDLFVGEIVFREADFPWSNGSFECRLIPSDKTASQILNYITHSKKVSAFYMNDAKAIETLKDIEDSLNKAEEEYNNLIDSDKWKIIKSNGEIIGILIPVFDDLGGIGWAQYALNYFN